MSADAVDCRWAAERVHTLLDGELDDAAADELRRHLEACEQCLETADVVEAVKRLVRRSCGGEHAPAALRARIVTQITVTRVERRA